jgi:NTP pyrophosphatase (non-canonical NTP hydrolase)
MTLERLLEFVAAEDGRLLKQYGRVADGTWDLAHLAKLTEEMGELAEQVLGRHSMQRTEKLSRFTETSVADEVADVIISAILVGLGMGVDIESALERKMVKIEARYQS